MAIKKGLGRGLESLFSNNLLEDNFDSNELDNNTISDIPNKQNLSQKNVSRETSNNTLDKNSIVDIALNKLTPDSNQPRKVFNDDALLELTNSIRVHGVITPIVVVPKADGYMIVAGERRFRACQNAGLTTIPAIIKRYSEKEVKEIGLIDNLQREDLNPIETATAIKLLMDEYGYTQDEVAKRIGKSRPNVTNSLRLLNLSKQVISKVVSNELSSSHARALVAVQDISMQEKLARDCIDKGLSVREIERLVQDYLNPQPNIKTSSPKAISTISIELEDLVNRMKRVFGTKITAIGNDKKGRISIDYFSMDDLDRFVELISRLENK